MAAELLLWRWSSLIQTASALLLAVFFFALSRALALPQVRTWSRAWLANVVALIAITGYWTVQPAALPLVWSSYAIYLFAKTLFVLIAVGASLELAVPTAPPPSMRVAVAASALFAFALASVAAAAPAQPLVLTSQSALIALAFTVLAAYLARFRSMAMTWLAAGFGLRGLMAAFETVVGLAPWNDGVSALGASLRMFAAASSALDAAAEWVIGLALLLIFHQIIQRDLARANQELRATQDRLENLLERDQLTGVSNRRALAGILATAQAQGAAILFFDIDEFKQVNDRHGHHVGDRCLVEFARALRDNFRPEDAIVRYAGDEFLVVAHGAQSEALMPRVAAVRARLAEVSAERPAIQFSVGVAHVAPGEDPERALKDADHAMYGDKGDRGGAFPN